MPSLSHSMVRVSKKRGQTASLLLFSLSPSLPTSATTSPRPLLVFALVEKKTSPDMLSPANQKKRAKKSQMWMGKRARCMQKANWDQASTRKHTARKWWRRARGKKGKGMAIRETQKLFQESPVLGAAADVAKVNHYDFEQAICDVDLSPSRTPT